MDLADAATPQPTNSPWPGEGTMLAGRYHLVECLATGSVGAVWRAKDDRLSRDVAIKLLLPHRVGDEVARERFRREALSAVKAQHPNSVAIFDTVTDDRFAFLVMEFVDGPTLKGLLDEPMDPLVAAALGAQVAAALGAAHDQGLVHRDIKPGNILIAPSGRVKVVDFGVAKALAGDADLTATGQALGTVRYLAPEQLTGGQIGPWSDVYALGLVIWEACAGRPAFRGDTPQATALARLDHGPEPIGEHASVPAELEAALTRALDPDPSARFAHGRELADAFGRVAGPRPHRRTRSLLRT